MTAPGTELPELESLDDAALRALIRRANELISEREHARKQDAIERARAILTEAGLSVQDMVGGAEPGGRGGRRAGKGAAGGGTAGAPRKGARYANPANPSQIHERGRGREPNWFKALRERGELPAPLD